MGGELCFALKCRGSRQRPALRRQCSKCLPGVTYVPALLDIPPHPPQPPNRPPPRNGLSPDMCLSGRPFVSYSQHSNIYQFFKTFFPSRGKTIFNHIIYKQMHRISITSFTFSVDFSFGRIKKHCRLCDIF